MNAQPLERGELTQAVARGNRVRAALLRTRSEGLDAGLEALSPLVDELAVALDLSAEEQARLRALLPPLLRAASEDPSSGVARALFDLQALCLDERRPEPYDFVGWMRSGGKRAAGRPRPDMHRLRRLRYLRHATRRMSASRAVEDDALAAALEPAACRLQAELFAELRPRIIAELAGTGLQAPPGASAAEAYGRIADTLLARALSEGFADFADLRDAISHLPAKLPDLTPEQLRRRDPLLLADARLDEALDGVYWRGEVYLRVLHRLQSIFFGTPIGRALSRYLLAPFGTAYMALSFLEYVLEHIVGHVTLLTVPSALGLGLVLCAILNIAAWRTAVLGGLGRWLEGVMRSLGLHGHHDEDGAEPHPPVGGIRGFVASCIRWYRQVVDRVDAGLYRVDEWIRFRGGDRRGARHAEGLALLASFLFSFGFRFLFRLVVEPFINPIKHFPVVTVVGKLTIASGLPVLLTYSLSAAMPVGLAGTLAFLIALFFIPGLAGFLVFEIRYNWNLYLANARSS